MAELTWSAEELAAELGVSEWLVRNHLDDIPHLWLGQRLVFPKHAVTRWLAECEIPAVAAGGGYLTLEQAERVLDGVRSGGGGRPRPIGGGRRSIELEGLLRVPAAELANRLGLTVDAVLVVAGGTPVDQEPA